MGRKLHCNNTSGVNGVTWDSVRRKWLATVSVDGKRKRVGRYATVREAQTALEDYARVLSGAPMRLP